MYRGKVKVAVGFSILILAAGCSGSATGPSAGSSGPEASGAGGTVVVYSSVDEVFAEPILKQFEKETGIQVALVPDTEETKSTGLVNRLIAEKGRLGDVATALQTVLANALVEQLC